MPDRMPYNHAAEKLCFVLGHDFSRAVVDENLTGFQS